MRQGPDKPTGKTTNAREVALDILTRVDEQGAYSNLVLGRSLQTHPLSRPDAALVTEIVYGTIQRRNTIDHFLGRFVAKGLDKLQPWVRNLLRLSFYQLYYLERIPAHAAVNEAVNIAKKRGHKGIAGMVNGVLRNVLRQQGELRLPEDGEPVRRIALKHSHPEWMVARWLHRYGEEAAEAICAANNEPPKVSVRVNRMRRDREAMARLMREAGAEVRQSALAPAGLVVESGGNMALTGWYEQGDISIQDESSMLVAEAVSPEPEMTVLDCCAAPGGKTAHLAELMNDRGAVTACDIHEHKEGLIAEQARRLGLSAIRTEVADAQTLGERFPQASFDRILLDAPCSGLGVIRRKPDLKWVKTEREVSELAKLQRSILEAVQGLLKPGGVLVYSTCTTEPEENQCMIQRFLERHAEFELEAFPPHLLDEGFTQAEGESGASPDRIEDIRRQAARGMVQILPSDYGTDGFFIARMRKGPGNMVK